MTIKTPVKVHQSPHLDCDAVWDVIREMHAQDNKWGSDRDLPWGVWHLILSEEVGEFAEAALKFDGEFGAMRSEIVQVAAVAVQMIEAIDREQANKNLERLASNQVSE